MSTYKNPSFNDAPPTTNSILSLCSEGSHRLLDFQWRFAVITKHSLVAHTDCLVQLQLLLSSRTGGKETRRTVQLELSMGEFNEFFREMEKIANTLAIIN